MRYPTIDGRLAQLIGPTMNATGSSISYDQLLDFSTMFELPRISLSGDGALALDGLPLNEAFVLLMMETRLKDLDRQVRDVMAAIQDRTNQSNRIQNRIQVLQSIQAAVQARQGDSTEAVKLENVIVDFEGREVSADVVLQELGISSVDLYGGKFQKAQRRKAEYEALSQELEGLSSSDDRYRSVTKRMGELEEWFSEQFGTHPTDELAITPKMKIRAETLATAIQQLQSEASELNNSNELQMVRMQSAMEQRAQVITMGTQMLKTMAEAAQQIARNL